MVKIAKVVGREIFDSRLLPTLECHIILEDGRSVIHSVPAGVSRGGYEAYELRDGGT
jgi:enolase